MSEATATMEFDQEIKQMGDKIASLTLKQAKSLSDYLKHEYQIEPAAGGAVMMAPAGDGGGADAAPAKSEFDVVLTSFGEKKLDVVKLVKTMTGSTLMESKKLVESVPATIKQAVPVAEAKKLKSELEAAGGTVELK
jgi:large subunit ribosomal protein L7/L12